MEIQGDMIETTYSILVYKSKDLPKQYTSLIYSKWMKSYRYGNDWFKLIDAESFYNVYPQLLGKILGREECVVRLAVLSDDPDVVLGFSVCRDHVLDYIHVHKDQRLHGIGTSLFPYGTTVFTHLTKTVLPMWHTDKYKQLKFNPFA